MAKIKGLKNIETVMLGKEPDFTNLVIGTEAYDNMWKGAVYWYEYQYNTKKGVFWLTQYLDRENYNPENLAKIQSLPDHWIDTTACWVAHIAFRGCELSEKRKQLISNAVEQMVQRHYKMAEAAKIDKPKSKVVDIQARTRAVNEKFLTATEAFIDELIFGSKLSMYDFLKSNNATPAAASTILERYKPELEEVQSDDEQVVESYGKTQKKWIAFWTAIVDDIERYLGNKKVVKERKPRTIKIKPIEKIVEKVQYKLEDPTLKLVSVPPSKIIGAQQVWFFNTKYRTLGVYFAETTDGFGIKGTTITGYDEKTSVAKGARKPEEMTKMVLDASKVTLRRVMDNLKTTARVPNGRLNGDTIILRVV